MILCEKFQRKELSLNFRITNIINEINNSEVEQEINISNNDAIKQN